MVPERLQRHTERRRVLDHGHVALVDVMGDDERIASVARLSYEGSRTPSETRTLLRYLLRHRHTSPFEQAVITLDIRLPIFVARQLVRHRMQSLNEVSARYTPLPADFYVPDPSQVCGQSAANRQGRAGPIAPEVADEFRTALITFSDGAFGMYEEALNDDGAGNPVDPARPMIARETARLGLPVNTYTHWWTTWDLHNLLHMLALRLDHHAQWEIRQFAEAIADIVRDWVPLAWEAFEDYRLKAHTFSRAEVEVLKALVARALNASPSPRTAVRELFETHEVETTRERGEFLAALGVTLPPSPSQEP